MSNKLVYLILLLFLANRGYSQNCTITLTGKVVDEHTQEPLDYVNIYIPESEKGTVSDANGSFELNNICPDELHIRFSHIGCEMITQFYHLTSDTFLLIEMEHSDHLIEEITVKDETNKKANQHSRKITVQEIKENGQNNLAKLLSNVAGVSTLKNGSTIGKPIVHGMYGNRLTLLNNGVTQSGQQWGNDHSPEIDPLVANEIEVIKGTAAIEYQGSNLGNIVLVKPAKIKKDPHLHGSTGYYFNSNGKGHGLNLQLQKTHHSLAWKINTSVKRSGDTHAAEYLLKNTGTKEYNVALQLEKQFSQKLFSELFFSSFNNELGVLRGSHIGNLTDLEEALQREIPFYTTDTFSYQINAPFQQVHHHLLKLKSSYFFTDNQWTDITLAGQVNNRKEFDVRRSGRTDIPAISLFQYSGFGEIKYISEKRKNTSFKSGLQFNYINNSNDPQTGILPLIPDYISLTSGGFLSYAYTPNRWAITSGVRYDNVLQNAVTITNTTPREIKRYNRVYHNMAANLGVSYRFGLPLKISQNIGYVTRNPEVNEFYASGLHQGVSGIEEGDVNLNSEKSLKLTTTLNTQLLKSVDFEVLGYYQNIQDYIFLQPDDEIRLTIRGAFPVFTYTQTDANLLGMDITARWDINKSFEISNTTSLLKGRDSHSNLPIINLPSNRINSTISYEYPDDVMVSNQVKFSNIKTSFNHQYISKQNEAVALLDYVDPPDAYHLYSLKLSSTLHWGATSTKVFVDIDNLLNTSYRDYLNRLRYFADDLGRNVSVGVIVDF